MRHRVSFAVWLVACLLLAGATDVFATPSPIESGQAPVIPQPTSGLKKLTQAQPTQAPAAAAAPDPASAEPIGNVATLTGRATVTRNNTPTPLKLQDDIFLDDELETSANSTLGVTFNDATTFNLTANARITVDSFVYEEGGKQNAALFDVTRGTVAFVAAAVAKTGDMTISTPTSTLGIRGTTGVVEVPEGASAANPNHVAIKLYPDQDGHVGRIEVNGRDGARLGFLTQGSSGFTIRPGAGGRFSAAPLFISPQQALRDRGFVRQVHAAQSVGRQIVTQQRALRQANPNRNNLRNNPARQPNLQRQNGPQRQNGLQRPNDLQRQNGLPQRPGSPQPALPNRPGQQQMQRQPGLQPPPGAPGLQRPAGQLRPALPARRAAPKGKQQQPLR
jgi:FecR protein